MAHPGDTARRLQLAGPVLVAAAFAAAYVIIAPPSLDLASHLYRAHLFGEEGFGLWDDNWYSGHHVLGYSVVFPAVAWAIGARLAAGLAAVATAAVVTPLARRHLGDRALAGTLLFGAATAIDLYTGRLAFAFGLLPAAAAILCLDRRRLTLALVLAVASAACSPVTGLFTALAAAGYALAALNRTRRLGPALPGTAVVVAALAPIGFLVIAFPEGGTEPFALGTMVPVLAVAILAGAAAPRAWTTLRAACLVYAVAVLAVYLIPSPIGSNIARLGTLLAAPLAVFILGERRSRWWRRFAILPLLYIGWQAPVQNVVSAASDPSTAAAYYTPLLRYLRAEAGGGGRGRGTVSPFRIEIPFTRDHWEAYWVGRSFALARGWERQLDRHDNPLFYDRGALTAARYRGWLHRNAIRFVAVPDAPLDSSAVAERALIDGGLPYLRPVRRFDHWRVYAVRGPTPIAQGVARLIGMGPDWLTLHARSAGTALLHVRFTPYWALTAGSGCVEPDGDGTRLVLWRGGTVRLATEFSLGRIGARSPRCHGTATAG